MGVSIELYRCHIGIFDLKWRHSYKTISNGRKSGSGMSVRHIPVLLLLALLLISGIELNPGPAFTCPVCKFSYSSISDYASHVKIHQSRQRKNQGIPCCFGCQVNFKNIHSFDSHISRLHRGQRKKEEVQQPPRVNVEPKSLCCPVCQHRIISRPEYMKHMAGHLKSGLSFECPLCFCL